MTRALFVALLVVWSTGCSIYEDLVDDDDEPMPWHCPEGIPMCDGDMGMPPPPEPVTYSWLHIVDDSPTEEGRGGDGVDICGVYARCDGEQWVGALGTYFLGAGEVCDGTTLDGVCETGVDRTNPNDALDAGERCRPHAENEAPPSDFVSLGLGGRLSLEFDVDLRGCEITVVEQGEGVVEAYDVYVCTADRLSADDCLGDGLSLAHAEEGGTLTFAAPE